MKNDECNFYFLTNITIEIKNPFENFNKLLNKIENSYS